MADAKKSPAKKTVAKKAAANKAAPEKAAAKKPAAKKAAAKKPAARKAAPKKKSTPKSARPKQPKSEATDTAGASAPRPNASGNTNQEAPRHGFESVKPKIAAAAEAIESTVSDFIDKADVQDFPNKLWRFLAMVAFAFVGYWVFVVTVILAAMQWVVVLLSDKPSSEIAHYMGRCSAYIRQVLDLLSYRSETLPWPLGPLPGEEAGE